MKYPKRDKEHIKETKSWVITGNKLPQDWILRQLSERDYGVDAYIELILNKEGFVSGDVCFIQLKSTDSIRWKKGKAKLPGIKKSTINYWMSLPAPVFIFWIDLSTEELYFCSIKSFIRTHFDKFINSEKTMSITFNEVHNLEDEVGLVNFLSFYFSDKHLNNVHNSLRTLVVHLKTYLEFILINQGRDFFLTVEEDRILSLIEFYNQLITLNKYSFIKWECMDLETMFNEDFEQFGEYDELHELFFSKMLSQLQCQMVKILKYYKEMFTIRERAYWINEDKILFRKLDSLDIEKLQKNPYSFDEDSYLSF